MASTDRGPSSSRQFSRGEVARLVLATLLVAALAVFCLANTGRVRIDYLFGKASLPLIEVMGGSVLVGILIATLIRRRHRG